MKTPDALARFRALREEERRLSLELSLLARDAENLANEVDGVGRGSRSIVERAANKLAVRAFVAAWSVLDAGEETPAAWAEVKGF